MAHHGSATAMDPAVASAAPMVRHAIAMVTMITKCVATTALLAVDRAMAPAAMVTARRAGAASWNAMAAVARPPAIAMTTTIVDRQDAIGATTVKTTKIRP